MRLFPIVLLLFASFAQASDVESDGSTRRAVEAARKYRSEHGARILREYAQLLAIPNVPNDPEGLRRTAESIRRELVGRGADVELLELPGVPPIVLGKLDAPGARRTLGVYVHYDGQPVDPERWTHPPFQPTLYDAPVESGGKPIDFPAAGEPIDAEWRIYARSARYLKVTNVGAKTFNDYKNDALVDRLFERINENLK